MLATITNNRFSVQGGDIIPMFSSSKFPVLRKIPVLNKIPILNPKKIPVLNKIPILKSVFEPPKKIAVTREEMAMHIGQCRENILPCHIHYMDALYASIEKLVFKQAAKYSQTCYKGETEDLAQDCWFRIMEKIHLYNSSKSKFSTWVVTVSNSVLNKLYRKGQKKKSRFVEIEEEGGLDENRTSDDDSTSGAWSADFLDAINDLKKEYPDKVQMINGIFMDESGNYNDKVVYNRAARASGASAAKISNFFKEVVRPFFYNRFAEGML